MDHESKFSFSRGNTQQVVLIIPAPVTAISQPIKLNDGAEAGRIRHNRYLLGCVCMQTRVRERASYIMPPTSATHVQHVTESRKTPQSKIYAS